MSGLPRFLNSAWMLSCAREAFAFRRAVKKVRVTQERILAKLLDDNRDTSYGRRHGFASIRSVGEYQRRVPLVDYEELRERIARIACGESAVLTRDAVRLLEPTGGSSRAEKLIPYTASLQREFQRAIAAWVFDVMSQWPQARRGRAYWSISPLAQPTRSTAAGIPIGFDDDRDYLSRWQRAAVSRLMVIPPAIRHVQSVEQARYLTALHLLASEDLSLMSVWSPTWLTSLFADVPNWLDAICEDLRQGRVGLSSADPVARTSLARIHADARRAEHVQKVFASAESTADWVGGCWPHLTLVSCWGDATSALYLDELKSQIPQASIQPKGLLATEGVVSIPLLSRRLLGTVLAVRSHFFEFGDASTGVRGDGRFFLADELELGGRYRVVLTTGGGLYRYDLGDEIEVVGFYHRCPCIRLLGRVGTTCDLVGEKLAEPFVRSVLERVLRRAGIRGRFAWLAPVAGPARRYRLYLQASVADSNLIERITADLEQHLRGNPQYRLAVEAKQLQSVDVQALEVDAWKIYESVCIGRGQKPGDIKPVALDSWEGWDEAMKSEDTRGSVGR